MRGGGLRRYMQCNCERCNGTAPHCTSCQNHKFLLPVSVCTRSRCLFRSECLCHVARSACSTLHVSSEASVAGADTCPLCLYGVPVVPVRAHAVFAALRKKKTSCAFYCVAFFAGYPHSKERVALCISTKMQIWRRKTPVIVSYNSLTGDNLSDRVLEKQETRKLEKNSQE